MTLEELMIRVTETTGLEVTTVESISTAVSNCFADLTSRGYRLFKEIVYDNIFQSNGIAEIKAPPKLRKTLYCRVQFENGIAIANRLNIGNPSIMSVVTPCGFRTPIGHREVIFYTKDTNVFFEWNQSHYGAIIRIFYGYYERLSAPPIAASEEDLINTVLGIREEFEDAVVLYCVYFFYQRYLKEDTKVQVALNNYIYLVEDLLHELAYEDTYNDNDIIITEE